MKSITVWASRISRLAIIQAVALALTGSVAHAGYLTINGIPNVTATQEGDNVRLKGTYDIENKGDETARNVYPSFQLGSWSWAGAPKNLDPNKRESWSVDEVFPLQQLSCASDSTCAGESLPSTGAFPMYVHRHYEDLNGYKFSAADITITTIGELSGNALAAARNPAFQARLNISGSGNDYSGTLEVKNSSPSQKRISVAFYSTNELNIHTKPQVMEIAPQGIGKTNFSSENFSGLAGSTYPVFAVLQWEDYGVRSSLAVPHAVTIQAQDNSKLYLYLSIGAVALALLSAYGFVLKPRKPSSPSAEARP